MKRESLRRMDEEFRGRIILTGLSAHCGIDQIVVEVAVCIRNHILGYTYGLRTSMSMK